MKKSEMLFAANYRYNFDRDLFVNREAKKAFSLEFVDDKPEELVRKGIEAPTAESGWTFYFNNFPPENVRRQLENDLEAA